MKKWLMLLALSACATRVPAPKHGPGPDERRQLLQQGEALYEKHAYRACADAFLAAGERYNGACCLALGGFTDEAFAALEQHAHDRRPQALTQVQQDEDLKNLRADARWAAFEQRYQSALAERLARQNAELRQLFDEDQADRQSPSPDWKVVGPRDLAREQRVEEILAAGGATVADDYWHAAMVFQHGQTVAQIERARALSLKALELEPDHRQARWLAAAALDRKLMYEKKPQKYGTQYTKTSKDGPWELYTFDPATTDAERAEWEVPSLETQRRELQQMNASP